MSTSELAATSAATARSAMGEDSGAKTAVRSAKVVSGVTLLSRILGLVRDVASAALFGTSFVWDAFVLAFMVPNLFRRLFGEGSLSAAFVPVYTQRRERDGRAAALRSLANIHTVLVLVLSVMAAAIVAAGVLLPDAVFAPFFGAGEAGKLALFRSLLPILMPFVVIVCATGLLGGALNVHGRFFVPAFAPVMQNVVWLGGIALAIFVTDSPRSQVMIVAAAVVIGGAIGFWHHVFALRRQVKLESAQAPDAASDAASPAVCRVTTPAISTDDPALRQVAQRMAPTLLGLGLLQISVLLDSIIAETFVPGDGAVSALYFGNRLMQFPLALIGVAMGIAVFPLLSRHAARGETAKLRTTLHDCTRITLFLAIPACVGLVALRDPIIEVIFRRGAFDADAQARTALVLGCYGLGVIAACVRMLQTRAFFAIGDTKTPVKIAVWVLGLNLILNVILVFTPLREGGLALSTALTAWLSMWLMARVLHRQLSGTKTGDENGDEIGDVRAARVRLRQSLRRSFLAAGAMVAVIVPLDAAIRAAGGWAAMPGLLRVGALVALVGAGVMVFVGVAKLLGASEVREVLRRG